MAQRPVSAAPRFGIGEWYGQLLTNLSPDKRKEFARQQSLKKADRTPALCPFKPDPTALCNKAGGVCSIRAYSKTGDAGLGEPIAGPKGVLRATCPNRFHQDREIYRWVGSKLLGIDQPTLVPEVGFLAADARTDSEGGEDVGRIDMVLLNPATNAWCALEIQAVYFSGRSMSLEFKPIHDSDGKLLFPAAQRRPDYRSSGPKRLMPQLQIKVPTLRRWGKKMAVVVDEAFYDSIGAMDEVDDISNADIAWFVVKFEEDATSGNARLTQHRVRYTTLERSVEGLTGGKPVPLHVFEQRIQEKAAAHAPVELTKDEMLEEDDD